MATGRVLVPHNPGGAGRGGAERGGAGRGGMTPWPEMEGQGRIFAGGQTANVNLFSTRQMGGKCVQATAGFSVGPSTTLSVIDVALSRSSYISPEKTVRSSIKVVDHGLTRISYDDPGRRDTDDAVAELPHFCSMFDVPGRKKTSTDRKRKRRKNVEIRVVISPKVMEKSHAHHIEACRGHEQSVICSAAVLLFRGVLQNAKLTQLPVEIEGTVSVPLSQPFISVYYSPRYWPAFSALYPTACPAFDIHMRFSAVDLKVVESLCREPLALFRDLGAYLLRSASLCYRDAWTGRTRVVVPADLARVLRIQCTVLEAADAFAVHKLVLDLPLLFHVRHGMIRPTYRGDYAVVTRDRGRARFAFYGEASSGYAGTDWPRVALKPPVDMPIDQWPSQWWCSDEVAFKLLAAHEVLHPRNRE